ncbi:hypothetical protein GCM10020227_05570 [Streptomyces flavovirens]
MLPHMTTPNTARDLDVIRAALGERKLNFLGVSYGTYLGAVYGTLFPSHVRRMVVDSVVNPAKDNIWYQANLNQDIAFQTRWEDWKTWVAKNDATYHIGDTPAKVEKAWLTLRAAARKNPIGGVVGPAELIGFFQSAPYYDSMWAPIARTWSDYRGGDTQALIDAAAPDLSDTAGNASSEKRQRGLHGRRVRGRQVAHQLAEVGPRQHPAAPGQPVHDVGQRLDEPALRDLAGQAADPAGRPYRKGPAPGAHRAVHT